MISKAILESHPVSVLKKEIRKSNIKGYSGLKKAEIIVIMLKDENKGRFDHIKMAEKKERLPSTKKQVEFLEALDEEDRKKAAKLPERKGPKKAAKVTTFGPAKPPRGIKRGGKKAKKEPEPKIDPLHQVSKEESKKSKPVKKQKQPLTLTKADGSVIVLKKRVKKAPNKPSVPKVAKKARKPRKLTAKGRIREEDALEKAYEKAMKKRGQEGFDQKEVDRILNEGYKELKIKYKKI